MANQGLPPLMVFPGEVEKDAELFERSPFRIIARFLECFDRNGGLIRKVPRYVVEALAVRFIKVNCEELNSLDQAFGGRIARQRNRLRDASADLEVVFRLQGEIERAESQHADERGPGTPFEIAVERTAEHCEMSTSNVRRTTLQSPSFETPRNGDQFSARADRLT